MIVTLQRLKELVDAIEKEGYLLSTEIELRTPREWCKDWVVERDTAFIYNEYSPDFVYVINERIVE